ncbi:MAG: hypothetical protein VX938_06835 [Myxococcota bacterium]|nr:hypothetical protein [Myxococcota bacterium]MEE2779856.1 hypothetical protein [Myxococcota bacterium]
MYEVSLGEHVHNLETRAEAIVKAKELSSEHRGTVAVTDDQNRERMTYQGGELISYDYETRRR